MKPADVYWIHDSEAGCNHLHIVLTHPEPYEGRYRVAVVNLTTIHTNRYDRTTELRPGDHPRIKAPSYVVYSRAAFEYVDDILGRAGYATSVEPLSPHLFKRVFDGLFRGTTSSIVRDYCSKRVGPNDGQILDLKGQ